MSATEDQAYELPLQANGENNNDGSNDNLSWNCGVEGETGDAGVNAMRFRQMRNFTLALMLAQGVPMLVMGEWVDAAVAHCLSLQERCCSKYLSQHVSLGNMHVIPTHQVVVLTAADTSCHPF